MASAGGKDCNGSRSADPRNIRKAAEFRHDRENLPVGPRFISQIHLKKIGKAVRKEGNLRARLRLLACFKRKKSKSIREIPRELVVPYSAMRDYTAE